jgi:hypothetical protein
MAAEVPALHNRFLEVFSALLKISSPYRRKPALARHILQTVSVPAESFFTADGHLLQELDMPTLRVDDERTTLSPVSKSNTAN